VDDDLDSTESFGTSPAKILGLVSGTASAALGTFGRADAERLISFASPLGLSRRDIDRSVLLGTHYEMNAMP
jgi:hypothetical protein